MPFFEPHSDAPHAGPTISLIFPARMPMSPDEGAGFLWIETKQAIKRAAN